MYRNLTAVCGSWALELTLNNEASERERERERERGRGNRYGRVRRRKQRASWGRSVSRLTLALLHEPRKRSPALHSRYGTRTQRLLAGWEQGIHSNQAESANEDREEEGDVFRHRPVVAGVQTSAEWKNLHSRNRRRYMHVGLSFYALWESQRVEAACQSGSGPSQGILDVWGRRTRLYGRAAKLWVSLWCWRKSEAEGGLEGIVLPLVVF